MKTSVYTLVGAYLAVAAAAPAAQPSAGPTTTVISGVTCTMTPGMDRAGGNYANSQVSDFNSCAAMCAGDYRCITAQYNEGNQNCYLKNNANPSSSSSSTDTVDCRIPTSGSEVVQGRTCTRTTGYDRAGGNLVAQYSGNFENCTAMCGANSACVTAQYNEGNQMCYLKKDFNPGSSSTNTDTVDCGPVPPPGCAATTSGFYYYQWNSASLARTTDPGTFYQNTAYDYSGPYTGSVDDLQCNENNGVYNDVTCSGPGQSRPSSGVFSLVMQFYFPAQLGSGNYTFATKYDDDYMWAFIGDEGTGQHGKWSASSSDIAYHYSQNTPPVTKSLQLTQNSLTPITLVWANSGGPGSADWYWIGPDGNKYDSTTGSVQPCGTGDLMP